MSLKPRTVVICGGARGIGRATAELLAIDGYQVVLTSRSEEDAEQAAKSISLTSKYPVFGRVLDQRDPQSVSHLIRFVFNQFGSLDALVVNSGVHDSGRIGMISEESVKNLWETNAAGVLRVVQASLKLMRKGSEPSIVLLGSMMSASGRQGQSVYSMTKGAVSALLVPASREFAAYGIRVNVVSPGYIETDMVSSISFSERQEVIDSTPLARIGRPQEVASVIGFLLSSESSYITGETIHVNGGLRD